MSRGGVGRVGGGAVSALAATHGSSQAGGADRDGEGRQADSASRTGGTGSVGQVGNGVEAGGDAGAAGASGHVWAEASVVGHVRSGEGVVAGAADMPGQVA